MTQQIYNQDTSTLGVMVGGLKVPNHAKSLEEP